ncbi:MAG: shikimate kinase [Candidatus Thermoplasmatota archaeon]|nr:shikimate kinase [Candidatus Thermoplasmatota archaeon]
MIGRAFCYGAASIVNAIPTGKGCAFGINLRTEAEVKLTNEAGVFEVFIKNDPKESGKLAENCARLVLKKFGLEKEYGARIITNSEIPISKGLKSSSTAANAVVLACYRALNKKYNDLEIINLGVDASLLAKTSITGAFDDACASYLGGVVATDNTKRKILKRYKIDKNYDVIIYVPKKKIKKSELNLRRARKLSKFSELAFELALRKNYSLAMLINSLAWSDYLKLSSEIELDSLKFGAIAAGISGTGPSVVILAPKDRAYDIIEMIKTKDKNAEIIKTKLNNHKKAY